jgi:AAA15 family ATPase/GTPase
MLTSLSVRGYRSIRDLELDLSGPVTVVLGPNGSASIPTCSDRLAT